MPTHSYAYRNNEQAILEGKPPEKYTRIVPHVPGEKIIEIGSAEGVLALLLAKEGKRVVALEQSMERTTAARALGAKWRADPHRITFVCGDILDNLHFLDGWDTLVAIRMVYHLKEDADTVIAEAAKRGVKSVVLGGNKNRAKEFLQTGNVGSGKLGKFNYYATPAGMRELLERHGYKIIKEITEGDPICVGER